MLCKYILGSKRVTSGLTYLGLLANHYVFESEIHQLTVFIGFSGIFKDIPENNRHKTAQPTYYEINNNQPYTDYQMLHVFSNLLVRSLLPCDVFLSTTTSKSVHITRYGWWLIHLSEHLSHQYNHLKVSVPFLNRAVCQNSGPNTLRQANFIFWLENIQGIQSNLILLDSTV